MLHSRLQVSGCVTCRRSQANRKMQLFLPTNGTATVEPEQALVCSVAILSEASILRRGVFSSQHGCEKSGARRAGVGREHRFRHRRLRTSEDCRRRCFCWPAIVFTTRGSND